jgi:hypothetical protein
MTFFDRPEFARAREWWEERAWPQILRAWERTRLQVVHAQRRLPPWTGRLLIGLAALVVIAGACVLYWSAAVVVWNKVIIPLATPAVVAAGAYAALRQARTARERHEEQTRADQQRRITESYSKAVEQLASDKIEVRLGGIYTLEKFLTRVWIAIGQ